MQWNRRDAQMPKFKLSPEEIGRAFNPKRWNAQRLFVSFCGMGETLLCKEMTDIICCTLKQGNIVNVTNNGTITSAINKLINLPKDLSSRLVFAFSLHYKELKNRNLLGVFAENVKNVMRSNSSFTVQLNLYDGYLEFLEEIKNYCLENFGALPQLALTRNQKNGMKIYSVHDMKTYRNFGKDFDSPMFEFACDNFLKKRTEFCHAGEKSYTLDLASGNLRMCYAEPQIFNIYDDLNATVPEISVGYNCHSDYCVNAIHFLALGVMPEVNCPSYAELRNRNSANWYKQNIFDNLNKKFQYKGK